jgi:hypothetical protein
MTKRKPGRPPGKKSDPNFVQISAYITKSTYRATKIRCFEEDQELSIVIQQLLDEWLSRTQNTEK